MASTQKIMSELFQQAVETYDAALKTTVKMQEEAAKWWSDMLGEAGSAREWQKRFQNTMTEAVPAAQRNAEEYMRLIEQNYKTSLDLLRRGLEAGQADSVAQAQAKTQELWEATLASVRTNAQAMVRANARAMEAWVDFARKNAESAKPEPAGV